MFWSESFIYTLKELPQEAESLSHRLLLRAGLVRMLVAGVYSYLPLGLKVLRRIEAVIRQEMDEAGAQELLLPSLQPLELWLESGRDTQMGQTMIRFTDRRGRKLCLGPTHEEVITDLAKGYIQSYKQLPFILYQIQTKFRDEIRPRFGLVRSCEFLMKDAYSFDTDSKALAASYEKMFAAYQRIFARLGLQCVILEADPGVMGGSVSHEFMVPGESGEDLFFYCRACGKGLPLRPEVKEISCPACQGPMVSQTAIEIGHTFQLGTKYTQSLGVSFLDARGERKWIEMGCYGIGVSRLIQAIIEVNHDEAGIIWPKEVTPYHVVIAALEAEDPQASRAARQLQELLEERGFEVLVDDREERPGVKLKDKDLLGIPLAVIIGQDFKKTSLFELQQRSAKSKTLVTTDKLLDAVREFYS